MDAINQIFANDSYAKYVGLLSMICMVSGYVCVLLAILRFMALGDGRQAHEGGYAFAFTTFVIGICLVGFQNYIDIGRATLGISSRETIAYGNFSGWQVDSLTSIVNLMRLMGFIFAMRALFMFREGTLKAGQGNVPKAFAVMFAGILLTNPEKLLNSLSGFLTK